jgi:hypothetical protein
MNGLLRAFAVLATALVIACGGSQPAPTPAPSTTTATADAGAKPSPASPADATALKAKGVSWTNVEVREYYLHVISGIAAADSDAKKSGATAEARARKAFDTRHNARMTCRAMMSDPKEVDDLHARDQAKYGHPDGPVFEQLVEHEQKKGLTGDAVYEAIVASSQRTDGAVNELLGVTPPK